MANTAEGITVGEEKGLDPNDPADFAAIMEGRGVPKTGEDTSTVDTSIASGLTYAEPGQTAPAAPERDERGRFVSNQERAEQTPPDTAAASATDTSGEGSGEAEDPVVAEFLAKYGGNMEEAVKGAAHAQSLIGRRDEERVKLETELAELRGQVAGLMAGGGRQQAPAVALTNDQVVEIASGRIETLGYEAAATEAANLEHTQGDGRAYKSIMEQWMIEDPASAMDFNTEFRLWQREQRAAAAAPQEAPAWLARVEEQAKVEQYGEALTSLRAELGDSFALVAQHMDTAIDQMPPNVLQMIDSNDAEARNAGFRIVADRALRLAAAAGAAPPAAPSAAQAAQAAVERKLAGARVASGALRPAETAPGQTTQTREDAIKEFKRQIVEAPTTNIASGLTFGNQ